MSEKDDIENEIENPEDLDEGDAVEGFREIEKDEEELAPPKQSNKILIALLGLVIVLALFVFFKGAEEPGIQDEVSIEAPQSIVPDSFSEKSNTEASQNKSDDADPSPGEMKIAGEEGEDISDESPGQMIVPIPKEELARLEPLSDTESERTPSESAEMALLKKSVPQQKTVEPRAENKSKPAKISAAKSRNNPTAFTIQLGAFKSKSVADKLDDRLRNNGYDSFVLAVRSDLYRVRVGRFNTQEEAKVVAMQIKKTERLDSFITNE